MPADRRGPARRGGAYLETVTTGGVDLHAHTTASDGELSPTALVQAAKAVGLEAIAITDHDTTTGIPEALAAADGIEVVPAIEISCDATGGHFHMLGYFIDHASPYLQEPLDFLRARRRGRAQQIVEKLATLGMKIEIPERPRSASVGRPHIAEALLKAGYVGSYEEAFHRFLADGKPAYVEGPKLLPAEAMDMIFRAGGVPVLAHPHTFDNPTMIGVYAKQGLCGIEAYYGSYDRPTTARFRKLADELGLIATCGSDFHGNIRPGRRLGMIRGSLEILERLRSKRRPL